MQKVKIKELREFAVQALIKNGVPAKNAEVTADTLVTTDMFGVMTHGIRNLGQYIEKINAGGLDAKAEPEVICEGPAFAVINGNKALGMVSGCKAMNLAIEKAKQVGIAYVGVKNSCHFGAAGYYANLAAEQGMIGLSMSNTDPVIAVPNGASKEKGMDIPDTWLVDEEGQPTTDSSLFPQNASLQPMGAHKGYGLAVLVEILSAVITGAGMLSEIASWNLDMSSVNNAGHAFVAIDIKQMMSEEVFNKRISQMINELKNGPKAKGKDEIFLPGEMEWEKHEKAVETGILEITDAMADSLKSLSETMDIELNIIK